MAPLLAFSQLLCVASWFAALDKQQRVYGVDRGGERVVRCSAELQFEQVLFDLAELEIDPPHAP